MSLHVSCVRGSGGSGQPLWSGRGGRKGGVGGRRQGNREVAREDDRVQWEGEGDRVQREGE